MARTWILDTDTKGTGAQMVPIEKVEQGTAEQAELNVVRLGPPGDSSRGGGATSPGPARFRVEDVMTRQLLADGADVRGAIEALAGTRSVVDVSVYVRRPGGEWRRLSLPERRRLWRLGRGHGPH